MARNIVAETEDENIFQLVTSGVWQGDDDAVEVYLHTEEEAWTLENGLRLTEDDAWALVDALEQAAQLVVGSDPQAFIRLVICEPPTDRVGLSEGRGGEPG